MALMCLWGAAPPAPSASGSSLKELAQKLASQIAEAGAEPPVSVSVQGAWPRLNAAFTTLLLSELADRRLPGFELQVPASTLESSSRERGARSLVRLELSAESELAVAGDLLSTWVNFWSGSVATRPAKPAAILHGSVRLDLQAKALLSPASTPQPPRLVARSLVQLERPPAALASGDLDGDGAHELAVLTDDEVQLFSSEGKALARRRLDELPPSATPCREPFGAILVTSPPAQVLFVSSRWQHGEKLRLGPSGFSAEPLGNEAPLAQLSGSILWGEFISGQSSFSSKARWEGKAPLSFPAQIESVSSAGPWVLAVMGDRRGWLSRTPFESGVTLRGVGSGSTLVDLDGDGSPELAASLPRYAPEAELVRVFSLRSLDASEVELSTRPALFEIPIPSGKVIQLIATSPGQNVIQLIAGVWRADGKGELVVLEAAR